MHLLFRLVLFIALFAIFIFGCLAYCAVFVLGIGLTAAAQCTVFLHGLLHSKPKKDKSSTFVA